MPVSVKHRGKTIELNEKTGVWSCTELALSDTSLPKIKLAIDKDAKAGRRMHVPAVYLKGGRWNDDKAEIVDVTITLLVEPRGNHDHIRSCRVLIGDDNEQVDISQLYPVVHREKLTEIMRRRNAALEVLEQADDEKRDLDSFTVETIREAMVAKADGEA